MIDSIIGAVLAAVALPPAEYNYKPSIPLVIIQGTASEVSDLCRKLSNYQGYARVVGCSIPLPDKCVLILPKGTKKGSALWRHEQAHCNGWRHSSH